MSGAAFVAKATLFASISAIGLCVCFSTVFQLGVFLFKEGLHDDHHRRGQHQQHTVRERADDAADPFWGDLLLDVLLIAAFILQHSLMARRPWKDAVQWLGLGVVERSLYIMATCGTLQLLMTTWQPLLPESTLWSFDTDSRWVRATYCVCCLLGWLCVIGVVMVLDYAELVGVKQVYYYVIDLDPPIHTKSQEYQRLFRNFRHPVLTGILIVLWAVPVMRVSRLVLALSLTVYTFYGHGLDMKDYDYICTQHRLKKRTLRSPQEFRVGRASSVSYG